MLVFAERPQIHQWPAQPQEAQTSILQRSAFPCVSAGRSDETTLFGAFACSHYSFITRINSSIVVSPSKIFSTPFCNSVVIPSSTATSSISLLLARFTMSF